MGRTLVLLLACAMLAGCSVRPAATPAKPPVMPPQTTGPVPLDRSKAFIAEVNCDHDELGDTVRKLSALDPHQKWTEQFVLDTVAEAKWLKKGEKLQGPLLARANGVTCESEIVIVRIEADRFAVRAVCSVESVKDAFQATLSGK